MDEEELNKIRKMVANESHALSTPIDFDDLINKGILKHVGKSYYVENLNLLPENIRKKIKNSSKGRYGIKVTFYKETNKMSVLSKKFKQFRD
ncbi:MAG: hypothetical protein IMY67_11415 [Bacteroidetes bacterium]|nr:hypothetical protein [Bacteroidota bacterium]